MGINITNNRLHESGVTAERMQCLLLTPNFSWVTGATRRLQPFQRFQLAQDRQTCSLSPRERVGVRGNATSTNPHRPNQETVREEEAFLPFCRRLVLWDGLRESSQKPRLSRVEPMSLVHTKNCLRFSLSPRERAGVRGERDIHQPASSKPPGISS